MIIFHSKCQHFNEAISDIQRIKCLLKIVLLSKPRLVSFSSTDNNVENMSYKK